MGRYGLYSVLAAARRGDLHAPPGRVHRTLSLPLGSRLCMLEPTGSAHGRNAGDAITGTRRAAVAYPHSCPPIVPHRLWLSLGAAY